MRLFHQRYWLMTLLCVFGFLSVLAFVAAAFGDAFYARGWNAYRQKRFQESSRLLSMAKRLQLGADVFDLPLAASLYHQGDYSGAIRLAEEHTVRGSDQDRYRNLIGVCRLSQSRDAEAVGEFRSAVMLDKRNPIYRHNLSVALERQGNHDVAHRERELALALSEGQSRKWTDPIALREDVALNMRSNHASR